MKNEIGVLCFICAVIVGCTDSTHEFISVKYNQDEYSISLTSDEIHALSLFGASTNTLSEQQAVEKVIDWFGGGCNKSVKARSVKNCIPIILPHQANKTLGLSSQSDTLAYIINFCNDLGFAVVAADIRIDNPILAYGHEGEFSTDTTDIGNMIFMDYAADYIERTIVLAEQNKDSLLKDISAKIRGEIGVDEYEIAFECENKNKALFEGNYSSPSVYTTVVEPYPSSYTPWEDIINTNGALVKVAWSQGSPYNYYESDNGNLGCTSLAVSQLMTYWKYPVNFNCNGVVITNWNDVEQNISANTSSNIKNQIQKLCYKVSCDCETWHIYGPSGLKDDSPARPIHALEALRRYGYNAPDDFIQYTLARITEELRNRRPVIAYGASHKTSSLSKALSVATLGIVNKTIPAHVWLIDGMMYQKRTAIHSTTIVLKAKNLTTGDIDTRTVRGTSKGETEYRKYVHMNWGWGYYHGVKDKQGIYATTENGCWYLPDVFDCSDSYTYNSFSSSFSKEEITHDPYYKSIHIAIGISKK